MAEFKVMATIYSIIVKMILIGICLAGIGEEMVFSLSDDAKEQIIEIPFATVDKGQRSGIRERQFVVITTVEEWEGLWVRHKSTVSPVPKLPEVDFGREMIVAAFSGERRTGGYGIEIRKIGEDREKGQLTVFYLETQPPPRSMVTQALTQPYHIVSLKRIDLQVDFVAGK